jgi:ABC-type multidrug transport system ATPase subunit
MDRGLSIASGSVEQLIRETVGFGAALTLQVEGSLPAGRFDKEVCCNGTTLAAQLDDVADELPRLLDEVRRAGCQVVQLDVRRAGLADVFMRLTGRDLRE